MGWSEGPEKLWQRWQEGLNRTSRPERGTMLKQEMEKAPAHTERPNPAMRDPYRLRSAGKLPEVEKRIKQGLVKQGQPDSPCGIPLGSRLQKQPPWPLWTYPVRTALRTTRQNTTKTHDVWPPSHWLHFLQLCWWTTTVPRRTLQPRQCLSIQQKILLSLYT